MDLKFDVEPDSHPPSNIHVLIGRNGVGKTHLLNSMFKSLVEKNGISQKYGVFSTPTLSTNQIFANIISVSFSAFDETEPLEERKDKTSGIKYSYIGLKRVQGSGKTKLAPKSPTILKNEFVKSVATCLTMSKGERWKNVIRGLEADPVFKEAGIATISGFEENEFKKKTSALFRKLSSGHKIVLLTITRLVETLEEKSLVLIDEPEAHLHPPLLSAFICVLSNLLIEKNGVAIIATHSPVILQEVPRNCVWKLRLNGFEAIAERPVIETFGENVGILTREVFGLEVTESGFHNILRKVVSESENYEQVLEYFNGNLGMDAKAIVRTLFAVNGANKI